MSRVNEEMYADNHPEPSQCDDCGCYHWGGCARPSYQYQPLSLPAATRNQHAVAVCIDQRDLLQEAIDIANGQSLRVPTVEHLVELLDLLKREAILA